MTTGQITLWPNGYCVETGVVRGVVTAATINKRARTDAQKLLRRQAILDAADLHFAAVGFDAFSMARLAAQAGFAKGTLYLYFETREDVLLALVSAKVAAWGDSFAACLRAGMTDRDLAAACYATVHEDPALLPLLARLDSVIEHNVSIDALVKSKRAFRDVIGLLATRVADVTGLPHAGAFELLTAYAALLIGATRVDQGPALENEDLPDDVRQLIGAFSSDKLFVTNACRIAAGIRLGI